MQKLSSTLYLLISSQFAFAANTGGVFSPRVNEGHRSAQYRISFDPDVSDGETGFAQRVHYQHSLNGDFMLRFIAQSIKTNTSDSDFDFVQTQLFWQLQDTPEYVTGLRFDLRFRDNDRPNQVGVNWSNQFNLDHNWYYRLVLFTSVQTGDNAADGVFLQTRTNLVNKSPYGNMGIELFSSYGSTEKIRDFNDQSHTVGPFWTKNIGNEGWSFFAGTLFGMTDASPDLAFRFRVGKSF